ncbi:MAG: hypothetical protein ABF271_02105, partial [Abyssibacter sp.]
SVGCNNTCTFCIVPALRGKEKDRRPGEILAEAVIARAVPFMGICVGMQMLATTGHEYEPTAGLDWIGGDIRKIAPAVPVASQGHRTQSLTCR